MPGLKIVLPTSFTDTSLPVLRDDAILSSGSLMLVDAIHSTDPWAAGVPATGFAVPNIAWKEASALLGSGTQSSLRGTLAITGSINNNTKGKLERSGKGGFHAIVSQANALASNDGVTFSLPLAVKMYLVANPSHAYYYSAWDYVTRIQPGTVTSSNGTAVHEFDQGNTTTQLAIVRTDSILSGGGVTLSQHVSGMNILGARFVALGVSAQNLSNTSLFTGGPLWGAASGTYNAAVLASRNNLWQSSVLYRYYLEDLTVSGRSFATVDALDYALYTAAVTTTGGRYNADTFTAASTVA